MRSLRPLHELLAGVDVLNEYDGSIAVSSIAIDPELAHGASLFINDGGSRSAAKAAANGAHLLVLDARNRDAATLRARGATVILVPDIQRACAVACANYFGNAHRELVLIGVTGTKGKTTTTHLIDEIVRRAGHRTTLVSSVTRRTPEREFAAKLTTPGPFELHELLRQGAAQGATHAVIEVSSIGLAEQRIHGLRFASVVFTNLGADHLEYHGGRAGYMAAKRRLFTSEYTSDASVCVLNADDPFAAELSRAAAGRVVTYGIRGGDVRPEHPSLRLSGTSARILGIDIETSLIGEHNLYNVLAAVTLAREIVDDPARIVAEAVSQACAPPGRLERVPTTSALDVFVDYAHTPESVEAVLRAVVGVAGHRRRVVVVGCGGQSDRAKRPLIARAAFDGSDVCILTSDNPRHEDPLAIIEQMLAGIPVGNLMRRDRLRVIVDRRDAIATAISHAHPDGIVLLLGKGDERVQEVRGRAFPFHDRQVAQEILDAGRRSAPMLPR